MVSEMREWQIAVAHGLTAAARLVLLTVLGVAIFCATLAGLVVAASDWSI